MELAPGEAFPPTLTMTIISAPALPPPLLVNPGGKLTIGADPNPEPSMVTEMFVAPIANVVRSILVITGMTTAPACFAVGFVLLVFLGVKA